jgi:murein DD-endopeptidase MepM/ murein hydrolase activator NlpD
MIRIRVSKRKPDAYGSGEYGAPRGDRTHNGIDYTLSVLSPVAGTVTKLGYPYSDDLSYRYVEVTDSIGYKHRVFYIRPVVKVGDVVSRETEIGQPQDVAARYTAKGWMSQHVHYEIKTPDGDFVNPEDFV